MADNNDFLCRVLFRVRFLLFEDILPPDISKMKLYGILP